jgi:hypothetical protein
MIPSYITRKMIWSEILGIVSVLNWLWSKLSCAGNALLDMIQLCKLNYIIQLLLLLLLIPSRNLGR